VDVGADEARDRAAVGIERLLRLVEAIPAGSVATYGDLAGWAAYGGPRNAGQVLAWHGGAVPWHRVVNAAGRPPALHAEEARARWADEGTPTRASATGTVVDLERARWRPTAADVERIIDGVGRGLGADGRLDEPSTRQRTRP
jgi:alkylated DNA nucleotide flippase Atl1